MTEKNRGHGLVGYANPPTDFQFRKGISGNPRGRPKGSRSWQHDLKDVLGEAIDSPHGAITKQLAIISRLVNEAVAGEPRSLALLLALAQKLPAENAEDDVLGPDDDEILLAHSQPRGHTSGT